MAVVYRNYFLTLYFTAISISYFLNTFNTNLFTSYRCFFDSTNKCTLQTVPTNKCTLPTAQTNAHFRQHKQIYTSDGTNKCTYGTRSNTFWVYNLLLTPTMFIQSSINILILIGMYQNVRMNTDAGSFIYFISDSYLQLHGKTLLTGME